ncbi:immunity 70 family protein [Streptococcus oricebi]|uniref:Immunity protein 70 n=1 Tax=Streptococcus oricebi TaxID=1547447 RepID=A0ABS5B332_9STRE|nr:immunity 70 family protein [Streptococcus oricebi]MBP2623227.1 hypothetical protein [Streptococcus oricebi]
MTVGLKVDLYWYPIGNGSFLHSFFSTIAVNLEDSKWGSRFPVMMNELYQGNLLYERIDKAKQELSVIKEELSHISPKEVVWDIDDLSAQPPWGDNISPDITDLSNYFVTSRGDDLIETFQKAFVDGLETQSNVEIDSL